MRAKENADESVIKLTGEVLAVGAGNIAMGEEQVIALILKIKDDLYTILFMHHIELTNP